ncbi:serine hydrolase domain-containing protein [Aquimarina rhabdastrellae]
MKILTRKRIITLLIVLGIVIAWQTYLLPTLKVATGYAAKYACSHQFLSNISKANVDASLDFFPTNLATRKIDEANKKVEVSFFGFLAKQTANFYRNGDSCGCVLGDYKGDKLDKRTSFQKVPAPNTTQIWPEGDVLRDSIPEYINAIAIDEVLKSTLEANKGAYAILVAYKNWLVAEEYQEGVQQDSRILGWSMTKSVGNAFFGIMEKDQKVNIKDVTRFSTWANDDRKTITVSDLLRMNSGLKWSENYGSLSDVTRMLYLEKDFPAFAKQSPLAEAPGTKWLYSSGTSNLLSKVMRNSVTGFENYNAFPKQRLFDPIGMKSAVIETDNVSNYVLSSYCWATARDWTRFGLLYLYKGNWFGKQIFTEEWVDYSTTPVADSDGLYGAQIWLNATQKRIPSAPKDAFFENGFGGQRILIIPSKDLVITVMSGKADDFDFDELYTQIFKHIKQ